MDFINYVSTLTIFPLINIICFMRINLLCMLWQERCLECFASCELQILDDVGKHLFPSRCCKFLSLGTKIAIVTCNGCLCIGHHLFSLCPVFEISYDPLRLFLCLTFLIQIQMVFILDIDLCYMLSVIFRFMV